MNLENLNSKQDILIEYLKSNKYSVSYLETIQREIRWLLKNQDGNEWNTYEDALKQRAFSYNKKNFSRTKTIFTLIERFEEDSVYPNRTRHSEEQRKGVEFSEDFQGMAAVFEKLETQRPLKPVTIRKNSRCFQSFLYHMHSLGRENSSDISETDVLSFFRSESGKTLRGYTAKRIISHALGVLSENGFSDCRRLMAFVPLIKYHHKNVQYLTDDEVQRILAALKSEEGTLSLRDRAIGLLLIYTGMRASDIASLKMADIDWLNGEINCIQKKTGVPLHLPLLPVVGNAIYDYYDNERPESDCKAVFLSTVSRKELSPTSICSISYAIYKAAGVRTSKGDRKGTHIFRHHFVTALLSNGIGQPIISYAVGHSSPGSLTPYLHADIENLRKCALDVSRFPIRREVG